MFGKYMNLQQIKAFQHVNQNLTELLTIHADFVCFPLCTCVDPVVAVVLQE